ncbi:NAD(P)/FAD-dependent oxidoreductase [Vibrio salinus]|uniref:NAD(P)/FAD-dependent oxidoreductase n=1 Tax=Vibrio salinus TaxID=2899784 RepID=UPI001E42DA54|nr:FAD-dependent oxidoreductase [Vibrio salinus]MCE0493157.1 FAD-dependent oxidoreductase [Vibrio salinus]
MLLQKGEQQRQVVIMTKRTIVLGAGLGGISIAYELRQRLPAEHDVVLINEQEEFQFVPSNPWVALGVRTREQVVVNLIPYMEKFKLNFKSSGATHIDPEAKTVITGDGESIAYDYLVICTGPKLAFETVSGAGPENGYTQSVCTVEHALKAYSAFEKLITTPGPVIVGAMQGASCFGPAYEYILSLESELRKRKIRDKVPMTFVTSEPYIGHMGLGGVGDSKSLMEHEFRERGIRWICNAKIQSFEPTVAHIEELNRKSDIEFTHDLEFSLAMFIPPFKGTPAVAAVPGLCNPKGFVFVDDFMRSPEYNHIFAAGVCVAIPPLETTPVPVGAPKTGFMIESMTSTIVENIIRLEKGEKMNTTPTLNALCLADMGDKGAAFVALPQNPPRNVNWTSMGKWVHIAKIAFEKYFLYKVKNGTSEPLYEKYMLKAAGIERTKEHPDK